MRIESIVSPTVKILTALFLSAAAAVPAQAQQPAANWPARPITIIVPGAPGGTTDVPTRLVAQKLSARLGQPVIVENRPGSGGLIGTQAMVRAPADGYTLLVGNTGTHAVNYSAYKNPGYKSADFYALTDLIYFPNVLVVNAQSPAKTVSELVAQMKKEPGKLTFSSAGIGQTTHLTSELFKMRTETNALHVTYKGATPATTAIVAGETDFMFDNLTQALPHIKSGRLRPLAVTSAERHPGLPDVPTMAQAGFNDFVVMGWLGFFASSQTPPAILAKLQENLIASMQDPEIVSKLQQTGGIPGGRSQASFSAMVNDEIQRWGGLIKKSNLSLD
jgi:tripartite-type tricarboxylate transporter receptor subunit TctC